VRVLKGLPVSLKTRMPPHEENSLQALSAASGGERQRKSASSDTGYSEKAQCTGTPAYLEPNSNTLQKPIGGLSALAFSTVTHMFHSKVQPINKGGIDKKSHNRPNQKPQKLSED
jgi:hypothetical protein